MGEATGWTLFKFHSWMGYVASHSEGPWSDRLKSIFSNEWGCKLNSLLGHSRSSSPETGKAPCCFLNSSWPQISQLNRITGFACKLLALSALLSAWAPLGCTSFRCSHQPFGSDGAGKHSPLCKGLSHPAWAGCGRVASGYSQFPKQDWRSWELPLALDIN